MAQVLPFECEFENECRTHGADPACCCYGCELKREGMLYRFPRMTGLYEIGNYAQMDKIEEEVKEAREALQEWTAVVERPGSMLHMDQYQELREARTNYGMELCDIIHAAETALRMTFNVVDVESLMDAVKKKNQERGYYEESPGQE